MPVASSTTVTRLPVSENTLIFRVLLPVRSSTVKLVLNSAGASSVAAGNMNLSSSMPPKTLAPRAPIAPTSSRNWRRVVSTRERNRPRGVSYGFSAMSTSGRLERGRREHELEQLDAAEDAQVH